MRNYSVCYLDAQGRTKTSEFLPFDDNRSATDYARIGVIRSPIVEVWRKGDLVVRLFQSAPEANPEVANGDPIAPSSVRADRHRALDDWINEGGSQKHFPEGFIH